MLLLKLYNEQQFVHACYIIMRNGIVYTQAREGFLCLCVFISNLARKQEVGSSLSCNRIRDGLSAIKFPVNVILNYRPIAKAISAVCL
jgi:hypothetical protein